MSKAAKLLFSSQLQNPLFPRARGVLDKILFKGSADALSDVFPSQEDGTDGSARTAVGQILDCLLTPAHSPPSTPYQAGWTAKKRAAAAYSIQGRTQPRANFSPFC